MADSSLCWARARGKERVLFWAGVLIVVAGARPVCLADSVEAITKPSGDAALSFVRAGRVTQVLVKPGEAVGAGQVLVQLDDRAERAHLAQLKAQSESTHKLEMARAELIRKKEDLKRIEAAAKDNAASDLEVIYARVDLTIAELSLALAEFEHGQDKLKWEEAEILVGQMQLASLGDGIVEKILPEPGESVDELEAVVRVVVIDPLWIDVPVPLWRARGLRLSGVAQVRFGDSTETAEGRIVHVAAVADAGSDTLAVRVELPNSELRPAGEHVWVDFPVTQTQPARQDR